MTAERELGFCWGIHALVEGATAMYAAEDYQRLEGAARLVARHADYPGKPGLLKGCLEEVEGRCRSGRLSPGQRDRLVAILLGRDLFAAE
jgi:hypothetical protein